MDYATPDIQLDRSAAHAGKRTFGAETGTAGEYPGFDQYGRVQRHMWVDGNFDEHVSETTVPNIPPIVEYAYTYDDDSNRETRLDARPGAAWGHRDYEYSYDGLDRLTEAERGEWNGSSVDLFTAANNITASEQFGLDMLGNWDELREDVDADGWDGGDDVESRTHNEANELTQTDPATGGPYALDYDAAGNILDREISASVDWAYTHDAWNRLVKVERESLVTITLQENEYNGLSHRVAKRSNTDASGGLDQQRLMYYSAEWQLLEERIDDDATFSLDPGAGDVDRP